MFFKFYNNVDKIFSHNDDLELPMLIWNSRKMLFITFFVFYLLNRCKNWEYYLGISVRNIIFAP